MTLSFASERLRRLSPSMSPLMRWLKLSWNLPRSAGDMRAHSFFLNLEGRAAAEEAEGEGRGGMS